MLSIFLTKHERLWTKVSKEYFPWYAPIPLGPTPPNGKVSTKQEFFNEQSSVTLQPSHLPARCMTVSLQHTPPEDVFEIMTLRSESLLEKMYIARGLSLLSRNITNVTSDWLDISFRRLTSSWWTLWHRKRFQRSWSAELGRRFLPSWPGQSASRQQESSARCTCRWNLFCRRQRRSRPSKSLWCVWKRKIIEWCVASCCALLWATGWLFTSIDLHNKKLTESSPGSRFGWSRGFSGCCLHTTPSTQLWLLRRTFFVLLWCIKCSRGRCRSDRHW